MRQFRYGLGLVLVLVMLTGCASNLKQEQLGEVAFTSAGIGAIARSARLAYDMGLIEPMSDADKGITAAIHVGQAAVHNANESVQAGDTNAFNYWLGVAQSAASQAATDVNRWMPGTKPAEMILDRSQHVGEADAH